MKSIFALATTATLMAWGGMTHAADVVKIGMVAELSGAGAPSGTNWRDGILLALDEINAEGGILGMPVEVTQYDTQTDPQVSRALVQKAIDEGAFAIWGTIYSGSTIVNMLVAQQNGVPQFVGSEAPPIVEMGNPYIFRTSMGAQKGVPALTPYFTETLGVSKVAVAWVNNQFGKGGHDVFVAEMDKTGIELVEDVPSEQGQADYAADIAKLKNSGAEAIFVYMNQEESARFLVEAHKQGLSVPLVGEVTLNDQKVIELAGEAANGVIAHVGLTIEAPEIAVLGKKFEERYGRKPIQDAIKGYVAAWTTKYVVEKVGSLDQEAFIQTMHGLCLDADEYPNILLDICWDDRGEVSRESFMLQVVDGESVVIGKVPAY